MYGSVKAKDIVFIKNVNPDMMVAELKSVRHLRISRMSLCLNYGPLFATHLLCAIE